jgi:hypothetical protein
MFESQQSCRRKFLQIKRRNTTTLKSEYREFPIIYRGEPIGTSLAALKVEFVFEKGHHHHP